MRYYFVGFRALRAAYNNRPKGVREGSVVLSETGKALLVLMKRFQKRGQTTCV
jgi:hypothetical protein